MISILLAASLAMPTDQVYAAIRECRALHGMDTVVRKQSGYGKHFVRISDEGVERIECYLPSGAVKVYAARIERHPFDMAKSCNDQGMRAVADDRNKGALKCVSKTPPTLRDRWAGGGK